MKEGTCGGAPIQRRRPDRDRRLGGECIDPPLHPDPEFVAGPSEPIEQCHCERDVGDVVRLLHMDIGTSGVENADSRQVRVIPVFRAPFVSLGRSGHLEFDVGGLGDVVRCVHVPEDGSLVVT